MLSIIVKLKKNFKKICQKNDDVFKHYDRTGKSNTFLRNEIKKNYKY